jgi:hypothetical protein
VINKVLISFSFLLFASLLFSQQTDTISKSSNDKQLQEATVKTTKSSIEETEVGGLTLTKKQLEKLPQFLGEHDPIKAMQLLPGIQSSGDGNGIYVRGGGIDQNLITLDDIPIYNVSHLFGFFSVFNASSIQKIGIHKGGMPANFGGRISSVVAITTSNGNLKRWKVDGGIGILATNLTIQGPIKKDTSSLLFSMRRTYVDLFKNVILGNTDKYQTNYYFYDLNFKYFHRLNAKNKLYINAFMGADYFLYDDSKEKTFSNEINWGTKLVSAKLVHTISEKATLTSTVGFTDYRMNFGASIYNYSFNLYSSNKDWIGKMEYQRQISPSNLLKIGIENTFHLISPNNFQANGGTSTFNYNDLRKLNSNETAAYISNEWKVSDKMEVSVGLRVSSFVQLGPYTRFDYSKGFGLKDSTIYGKGQQVCNYMYPEPRISASYALSSTASIKAGFSQNYQYIHLAPVSSISLPTDVWIPSSSIVKPQQGNQFSLGYYRNFPKKNIETSVEVYYKKMNNLIEYKEGVLSLLKLQSNYDDNFFFGKGQSYGIEFFAKKNIGKFTGWVGYTLSKSTRNFNDIENGRTFYAKNDRRHDISLVFNYELSKKWSFSGVFTYKTGNAMTIPLSRYFLQGNIINTYSPKNSYRIPAYHRCDVSFTYQIKKTETRESTVNFSVYNVYGRQNPFYLYFETSGDITKFSVETKAKQVSLFTILPSISYKFSF